MQKVNQKISELKFSVAVDFRIEFSQGAANQTRKTHRERKKQKKNKI